MQQHVAQIGILINTPPCGLSNECPGIDIELPGRLAPGPIPKPHPPHGIIQLPRFPRLLLNGRIHQIHILGGLLLLSLGFALPNVAGPFEIVGETAPEHELGVCFPPLSDTRFHASFVMPSPHPVSPSAVPQHNRSLLSPYYRLPVLQSPVSMLLSKEVSC